MDEKKEMEEKQGVVDLDSLELSAEEKRFLLRLKQDIPRGIAS